ncbi:MAG: PAS domain-containing protein [Chitinophagaceae bacterium]|nr:PAS domain-containing protein [Chitinophagaceae bacterium]
MNTLQVDHLLPHQLLHSRIFSVVITDLSGGYLYVNPLFQEKFSFISPNLLGRHFSETVFAKDVMLCNATAKACIKDPDQSFGVTVRKATDAVDYNWTQWELTCLRNEKGEAYAITCVGHDVTKKDPYNSSLDDYERVHGLPAIKMNDEQFISLVNHIPGVIYRNIGDEDFSILFISNEIENLTGYQAVHFYSNKKNGYSSLIYEEDKALVKAAIQEAINKKEQYAMEYRILHKDGNLKWVFERGQAVFEDDNKLSFLDGCIFDITEKKQFETALANSQDEVKRLALVAHSTTNSVMITDADENIIWVNQGFTRISGYTLDELKGKKIGYSLEGPEIDIEAKNRLRYAIDNKLPFKEEFLSYIKNGGHVWLEVDSQPLFDENGKHLGFMTIENDITRRKQAQQQQEELLQRLTLATDSAKIGIWEIDLKHNNKVIWDDTMFDIYGYANNPQVEPYKIWKKLMHPDDMQMMLEIITELVEGKKDMDSALYRIITTNGMVRFIESHAIVKKAENGKVIRLIGTNRNVTDDVLVQEKLKSQNKALRDIAFIQSHEVRRPLANILGVIEVLNNNNTVSNKDILDHLIQSANELDTQIRSIVQKTNSLDGLIGGF